MAKTRFYVENNESFEEMLETMNLKLISDYSSNYLKFIKYLFKKSLEYDGSIEGNMRVKCSSVSDLFLDIIKSLENDLIYDFFKEKVWEIPICFNEYLKNGNALLESFFLGDHVFVNAIHVPKKIEMCTDVSSYSHEMGHVAHFENYKKGVTDFYEYSEVLSILLEYFTFIFLLKEKGDEVFYRERLFLEKSAAAFGIKSLSSLNKSKGNEEWHKYLIYDIADSNKYFISSDFVFKSIDCFKEDRTEFLKLFSSTLLGEKSISEFGDSLGIKEDGCKRLIKEYERRM